MAEIATGNGQVAADLCRLVGLDPNQVISINVSAGVDKLVIVSATFHVWEKAKTGVDYGKLVRESFRTR